MKTPDTPTNWEEKVRKIWERTNTPEDYIELIRDLLTKQASLSERQGAEKLGDEIGKYLITFDTASQPAWELFDGITKLLPRTQEVEGEPEKV